MPNKSAKELLELFKKYCEDELLLSDDKTNSTNFGRWINEIDGIKRIKGRSFFFYEFNISLMREYLIKKNLIKREVINEEVESSIEEEDTVLISTDEE